MNNCLNCRATIFFDGARPLHPDIPLTFDGWSHEKPRNPIQNESEAGRIHHEPNSDLEQSAGFDMFHRWPLFFPPPFRRNSVTSRRYSIKKVSHIRILFQRFVDGHVDSCPSNIDRYSSGPHHRFLRKNKIERNGLFRSEQSMLS